MGGFTQQDEVRVADQLQERIEIGRIGEGMREVANATREARDVSATCLCLGETSHAPLRSRSIFTQKQRECREAAEMNDPASDNEE